MKSRDSMSSPGVIGAGALRREAVGFAQSNLVALGTVAPPFTIPTTFEFNGGTWRGHCEVIPRSASLSSFSLSHSTCLQVKGCPRIHSRWSTMHQRSGYASPTRPMETVWNLPGRVPNQRGSVWSILATSSG